MKAVSRAVAAGVLAVTFSGLALAGTAGATGPVNGTGTVSCAIAGKLQFNPPLSSTGTATSETITVSANLNGCHGTGSGTTIAKGKATGTATTSSNNCSGLTGTSASNLVSTLVWKTNKNSPKLTNTTVAFTSTTGSVNGSGKAQFHSTGSATAGSFSGDSASVTAVISQSLSAIANSCSKGKLKALSFAAAGSSASLS